MAQPPGTARYYPYNGLETWTTEGYATASFSPSAVGVNQVYWFGMTVAFSGSNKFGVWNPQTDTGDELDIQFMNGTTHYVSASIVSGSWDLYTPDSIYPVMNIKFEPVGYLGNYTINFDEPETWLIAETFTGTQVNSVDYVMKALPAGLGYQIPVYVLCFCTRYENPPGEAALELTCGKIMLNSSGAEPQLMMAQMSAEENASVLANVRESVWWQKVVSLVFGGGYPAPLQPESPPAEPPPVDPPPSPEQPIDNGDSKLPDGGGAVEGDLKVYSIPINITNNIYDMPRMRLPSGFQDGWNELLFKDNDGDGIYETLIGVNGYNEGDIVIAPVDYTNVNPNLFSSNVNVELPNKFVIDYGNKNLYTKREYWVDSVLLEISLDNKTSNPSGNSTFQPSGIFFAKSMEVKLPGDQPITDDFIYDKIISYYPNLGIPYINNINSYYYDLSDQYVLTDDVGRSRISKLISVDQSFNEYSTLKTSHGNYYRINLQDSDGDGIYDSVFKSDNSGHGGMLDGYECSLVGKYDSVSGVQVIGRNRLELIDSIMFLQTWSWNNVSAYAIVYNKNTGEYSYIKIPLTRFVDTSPDGSKDTGDSGSGEPVQPPPPQDNDASGGSSGTGTIDPVAPPVEPPPNNPTVPPTDESGTQLGAGDGEYAGPDGQIPVPEQPQDSGMDLVNSIIASGKVGVMYYADSGYNRMYQLAQAQLGSPMSVLGTSGIGSNLIQTNQGIYWYGVLEDRDNDGFFETIIYNTTQDGMGGIVEAYPSELVGLYVTQAPPGTVVLEPNIFSITGNEGNMQISMHSIIGVADQYLAIIKTPERYIVSEVSSGVFTAIPTI